MLPEMSVVCCKVALYIVLLTLYFQSIFLLKEIEKFRQIAREVSSLFTVAHMDMMRLDCDDLKRGLASKAHGYAEMLLTRLAEDHRKENQRSVVSSRYTLV